MSSEKYADLVRKDKLGAFEQLGVRMGKIAKALGPEGPLAGFAWQAEDLHASGASGNAAAASPVKGQALLAHMGQQLADILIETADFDLAQLG